MSFHLRSSLTAAAAALLLVFSAGCHFPDAKIPEEHPDPWTPSEIENMLGGADPMEGFNRSMFSCTDFLMTYLADPLTRVYTSIFPRVFIDHLNNVCLNLQYPDRAVSCLLQAEWQGAGDESLRFLANTTLGVAGIFDVADRWWHIPSTRADMGQTFSRWGIGPGETFCLPILTTLNGRDLIGLVFDTALDLRTYIPYAGWATALNQITVMQSAYSRIAGNSVDPYKDFRQAMLVWREPELTLWRYHAAKAFLKAQAETKASGGTFEEDCDGVVPPASLRGKWLDLPYYSSQDSVTDSLRVMMFQPQRDRDPWYMRQSIFNRDFAKEAKRFKIELLPGRPEAHFNYFEAPELPKAVRPLPEKLVLLLPGIGGSCDTGTLLAFAERFHDGNCKVATFDSTFHWRFIAADSDFRLPGYLPDDAERVRKLLCAALAELRKEKKIDQPEIILAGYSLGALQALKIAEMEENDPQLGISRYLAVNPPVSVAHALQTIDSLAATSAGWRKSELRERLIRLVGAQLPILMRRYYAFEPDSGEKDALYYRMEMDPQVSGVVAGLYLKLSMRDLIFSAHRAHALPGLPEYKWGSRNALYLAIDRITLQEYAMRFLRPMYPEASMDELLKRSGMPGMADLLKNSPKIRVFHSYDDFLLTPEQKTWLDDTLGEKLTWLSAGSHLGNLYYRVVTDAMLESVGVVQEKKADRKTTSAEGKK